MGASAGGDPGCMREDSLYGFHSVGSSGNRRGDMHDRGQYVFRGEYTAALGRPETGGTGRVFQVLWCDKVNVRKDYK